MATVQPDLNPSPSPSDSSIPIVCTYHVAESGADNNSGTADQPFATLRKGASLLAPGETLCAHAGTYSETFPENTIPPGTSWNAPVTLTAYPGEQVVIRPLKGSARIMTFVGPQSFIVVDGFVLDGANVDIDAIKITTSGSAPTSTSTAHHIRIVNSEIMNASDQGILITGAPYATNNEVLNCNIHNNGFRGTAMTSDHYHGIYVSTADNVIMHNSFHDNAGYGVHLYDSSNVGVDHNLVAYNRIYHNGIGSSTTCDGNRPCASGAVIGSGVGNQFYDNLVYDNQGNGGGVSVDYRAIDNHLVNNTIYGNLFGYGIAIADSDMSSGALVENNIVYGGTLYISDHGTSSTLASNLADGTDPLFANSATDDFRLLPTSPAIDSGATVSEVNDDFSGLERPQGVAFDIGAFEYPR